MMLQAIQRWSYVLIFILLLYWVTRYLRIVEILIWFFHISMPVILAFIFRFLLDPIIAYFDKVSRKVVCAILYTGIVLLFFSMLYAVIPPLVDGIIDLYSQYNVMNLEEYIHPFFRPIYNFLVSIGIFNVLVSMFQTVFNGFMYWGSKILIAFGISFYLLFSDISVCELLTKINVPYQKTVIDVLQQVKQTTFAYLKAIFLDFLAFFIGSLAIFYLIGLEYVLYIALFLAFTNLIPYLGPFIGGVPVIVYGFTISSAIGYMCIGAILLLQFVESNFIRLLLFKKCLYIHPIILIVSLTIFGDWFGITGMIVTPLILAYISIIKKAIIVETRK